MKEQDYGWISPDGQFYKCGVLEHADFAANTLNRDDRELDKAGWIKITNCFGGRCVASDHYLITQAQYDTLLSHDFTKEDLENECIFTVE